MTEQYRDVMASYCSSLIKSIPPLGAMTIHEGNRIFHEHDHAPCTCWDRPIYKHSFLCYHESAPEAKAVFAHGTPPHKRLTSPSWKRHCASTLFVHCLLLWTTCVWTTNMDDLKTTSWQVAPWKVLSQHYDCDKTYIALSPHLCISGVKI